MKKVMVEIGLDDAEEMRDAMADVLCWCRGFNAGKPEHVDGPIGSSVDTISRLNQKLKDAIHSARQGP